MNRPLKITIDRAESRRNHVRKTLLGSLTHMRDAFDRAIADVESDRAVDVIQDPTGWSALRDIAMNLAELRALEEHLAALKYVRDEMRGDEFAP